MYYQNIAIEKIDKVALIRMICAEKLNPLDNDMGREMKSVLDEFEDDDSVRALVITGLGRAFSAGGDIKEMQQSVLNGDPGKYMDELTKVLYSIGMMLRKYPKPIIAAVNGLAVGAGMNLALSCDLVIASDKSRFSQGFIKLALIPGFGGTHILINQLPWQKAAEIAFLGDMIEPHEMERLGFVNRVVAHDDLYNEAIDLAQRLAEGPTLAYARTKRLFLEALKSGFEEHHECERMMQVASAETEDYAIGVDALNKKSKAKFIGK